MKKLIFCFLIPAITVSCTTVDIDRRIIDSGFNLTASNADFQTPLFQPEIEIVERPVYVPAAEAPPPRPPAGEQAVRSSNSEGIIRPQHFSHAAIIYDYNPDFVYEVYTQPLRVTDISLQPGERIVDIPFVSDSERFILGAGISYENSVPVQHVYVKPSVAGISATLIINTDRRVYRIILRSFSNVHMPLVRWRYPPSLPNNFIQPIRSTGSADNNFLSLDPRFLSFNYRVTHGFFNKPYWLPELVFDDGAKTYITFPDLVLQREMPAIFENRNDVLNYRVVGNLIIIDKLIENITVKIGRSEITITKRRR
jgi:type IV secretion system protein VirB9